jgi:hypothetical protein
MQRHIAKVEISPELIVKALHMPDGTEIFAAKLERGTHGYVVVLAVEHDQLPAVDESEVIPVIYPIVKYHREHWSFDWNAETEHDLQFDDIPEYSPNDPYPDPLEVGEWEEA